MNSASTVRAEIFEGPEAAAAFRDEWERLFRQSSCEPSTSFEWTMALAHHYLRPDDRFFVVRLHQDGQAIGFVPLVARRFAVLRQPARRLMPLAETLGTHSDILCARSEAAIDALFDALAALNLRWDCLRLSKLLERSDLGPLVESRARAGGWICRSGFDRAAYHLLLPRRFDEYFAARSAKFRNHARRAEKKLRRSGDVRAVEITDADGFQAAYDAVLKVEQASWKERHGTSIRALERQTAFYRELGEAAARAGRLHVQLLTLDGTPVAHNLGYVWRGTYSYLKTSYAAALRPLSPATFLRLRLIESLISRGIRAVDFPGKPWEWERQWTDNVRWEVVLSIYPPTLRGRALAALDRWIVRSSRVRRFVSGGTRPRDRRSRGTEPGQM